MFISSRKGLLNHHSIHSWSLKALVKSEHNIFFCFKIDAVQSGWIGDPIAIRISNLPPLSIQGYKGSRSHVTRFTIHWSNDFWVQSPGYSVSVCTQNLRCRFLSYRLSANNSESTSLAGDWSTMELGSFPEMESGSIGTSKFEFWFIFATFVCCMKIERQRITNATF